MQTYFINAIVMTIIGSLFFFGCSKNQTRNEQQNPDSSATKYISAPASVPKSGEGVGIVKKISTDKKFVELDHNDILGIMEAMAMEYPVHSASLLNGIKTGDSVHFTLTKTPESQFEVTAISKK